MIKSMFKSVKNYNSSDFSMKWSDDEKLVACEICNNHFSQEKGPKIEVNNQPVCDECLIFFSPEMAEVLYTYLLSKNPNETYENSLLKAKEKIKSKEFSPKLLNKKDYEQIREITSTISLITWFEIPKDVLEIPSDRKFLVTKKWLLNNFQEVADRRYNFYDPNKINDLDTFLVLYDHADALELYEKAIKEGSVIAECHE